MREYEAENRKSLIQQKMERSKGPVLPFAPTSTLPPFLAHDLYGNSGDVLQFQAFFREAVTESNLESFRIRKVDIYYYLRDNTVQIVEPRQENSGLPQGPFVKRCQVPREPIVEGQDPFYRLDDFTIGADVCVFGRVFHITDMSGKARGVFDSIGMPQGEPESYPEDVYTKDLGARRSRETGRDPNLNYGKPVTALKTYAEATLGRAVGVSRNLGSFLHNDRKVLRFFAEWDNSDRLFGGKNKYIVHFFLTDGTAEVREVHAANSGRDPFPMLLARARLPKNYQDNMVPHRDSLTDPAPPGTYYGPDDLRVGETIMLWGRPLLLCGVDEFTREYYAQRGVQQGQLELEESPQAPPRVLPPPASGLRVGSESDSLASCLHLRPKKPKLDYEKLMGNSGKVLRYGAKLVSSRPEDGGRAFVLSFYLADDTMSVFECKQPNSGVVGGKFMERTRVRRPDYTPTPEDLDPEKYGPLVGGCPRQYYQPQHLFVGAQLLILSHRFVVTDMDAHTLNYTMARPQLFPWADAAGICARLAAAPEAGTLQAELAARWRCSPGDPTQLPLGTALAGLRAVLGPALSEQEAISLCRAFDSSPPCSGGGGGSRRGATDNCTCAACTQQRAAKVKVGQLLAALAATQGSRPSSAVAALTDTLDSTMGLGSKAATAGPASTVVGGIPAVLQALRQAYGDKQHQLRAVFRKHDGGQAGSLDRPEFHRALSDACSCAQLQLSAEQHTNLVDYFFPGHVRTMRYSAFLQLVDRV